MQQQSIKLGENPEWRIENTKNDKVHTVDLVPQAIDILEKLRKAYDSEQAFPRKTSKSGHIEDPKKA